MHPTRAARVGTPRQRFGRLRLVADVRVDIRFVEASSVEGEGGDRSPMTKAVTGHRTPKRGSFKVNQCCDAQPIAAKAVDA